jgi:hypothetical protein
MLWDFGKGIYFNSKLEEQRARKISAFKCGIFGT